MCRSQSRHSIGPEGTEDIGKTKVLCSEVFNKSNVRNLKYFCVKVPHTSMNFNLLYGTSKRSNVPYEFDISISRFSVFIF